MLEVLGVTFYFQNCLETVQLTKLTTHAYDSWENVVAASILKRLVADLSRRRTGLDPKPVRVRFVVDKVTLGQVSSPSTSGFPSVSFHQCSITNIS
jgi:hypothetical protein